MHSTVSQLTIEHLRAAAENGFLNIESNLNRGSDGATVWSDARKAAFVVAKLDGMPSQSLTFVQIAQPTPPYHNLLLAGTWSVLDGRNRLRALLDADGTDQVSLTVEMIVVAPEERDKIPKMFVALNNGGVPLTPGEALRVACAPELSSDPKGLDQLATRTSYVIAAGRLAPDGPDAHSSESIIAHSLWKIRDTIQGPGRDQGQPTLVAEHSELFGPGGRRDRDKGFASLLALIEFVAASVGCNDWESIALAFGVAAHNVVSLGDVAPVLAYGCVCTNIHDKAWLPGNHIIELLLSQSLADSSQTWWHYFSAFLTRCHDNPELWITAVVQYRMLSRGDDVLSRRKTAGEFAAFARQNCVDTYHRGRARSEAGISHRLFHGVRLSTGPSQLKHRIFRGVRLPLDPPATKLKRSNADHGLGTSVPGRNLSTGC